MIEYTCTIVGVIVGASIVWVANWLSDRRRG